MIGHLKEYLFFFLIQFYINHLAWRRIFDRILDQVGDNGSQRELIPGYFYFRFYLGIDQLLVNVAFVQLQAIHHAVHQSR